MKSLKWKECSKLQKRNRIILATIYMIVLALSLMIVVTYFIIPSLDLYANMMLNTNQKFIQSINQIDINLIVLFPFISTLSICFCIYWCVSRLIELTFSISKRFNFDLGETI